MTIQMTNQSAHSPMGVVEDVLVEVHDFFLLIDFMILEMKGDDEVPIILGRPFLATAKVEIKLATGELELSMNEEKLRFCTANGIQACAESSSKESMEAKHVGEIDNGERLWLKFDKEDRQGGACERPPSYSD